MAEETANALHVGIGVAATCIGVACSVYHCCCRVWRRLKGYTPTAAAGAVAAAGLMAAGQLSSVTTVGPPPNRGDAAPGACAAGRNAPQESRDCQAAPQPQCSPPGGSQETSECGQAAQPSCSSASGPQPVSSKNFFLFLAVEYKKFILLVHWEIGSLRRNNQFFTMYTEVCCTNVYLLSLAF
jgi:hypothetical protein